VKLVHLFGFIMKNHVSAVCFLKSPENHIQIAYVLPCIVSRSSDIYQHGTKTPIVCAFSFRQTSAHVPIAWLSSAEWTNELNLQQTHICCYWIIVVFNVQYTVKQIIGPLSWNFQLAVWKLC